MAGLNVRTGLGIRYSAPSVSAAPANMGTVDYAAFSPAATSSPQSSADALKPNDPTGKALWIGVGSLALLVLIRWSLPR